MLNKRVQNLVNAMDEDFEAAIIKTQPNIFYFLDFDIESAGTLLILRDKMYLIIDSRYIEIVKKSVLNCEVILEKNALAQIFEILVGESVSKIFVENKVSVFLYQNIKEKLGAVSVDVSPALTKAIESLRAIKDEEEISRMKEAQRITDDCFTHILTFIKEGVREVDLMLEMEHFIRSHGAERVAFDTICVSDPNSSLPHGVPGENTVKDGCFITMDFGAKYKGYCTDMTRTVALGNISDEHRKVYATVLRAHLAGIAAAKPGVRGCDVDKVARDIIAQAGYSEYFGHGLGHSVGIEIHEDPRFSSVCEDEIKAGMMMTVEPGVYLPGRFGCRIEDTVIITREGCVALPSSNKELIVI